jgi:hypothetical protein
MAGLPKIIPPDSNPTRVSWTCMKAARLETGFGRMYSLHVQYVFQRSETFHLLQGMPSFENVLETLLSFRSHESTSFD